MVFFLMLDLFKFDCLNLVLSHLQNYNSQETSSTATDSEFWNTFQDGLAANDNSTICMLKVSLHKSIPTTEKLYFTVRALRCTLQHSCISTE